MLPKQERGRGSRSSQQMQRLHLRCAGGWAKPSGRVPVESRALEEKIEEGGMNVGRFFVRVCGWWGLRVWVGKCQFEGVVPSVHPPAP